jgi:YegS/Rv2252/BmrU family lipid kinase
MAITDVSRAIVILNPGSGNATVEGVRAALGRVWGGVGSAYEVHDLAPGEDLTRLVREAVAQGCDLVVAAGGDGTVSTVAEALVGTSARLGIIPLGTTNVLARELGVPLDVEGACRLLAGPHETRAIDAMRVGDFHAFTQIGIGIDALMIRDTTEASKKRFGTLAYVWRAVVGLAGFQPRRFSIAADDKRERPRASQVLLVNCGTLGATRLRWVPGARVDDGRIEVCIIRARTALDYLGLAWDLVRGRHREGRNVRYLHARRVVAVGGDRSIPVQADGEAIGTTPIEVRVVPGALRVVAPSPEQVHALTLMKIVHLSDVHVWAYTWDVRRQLGRRLFRTIELLRGRARLFVLDRLDEVVRRVLSLAPDHVLITGDLTTTALPIEFLEARRRLAPLLADPSRASVLPGNHDRSTWYSSHIRRFELAFGDCMPSLTYPWVRWLDVETAILGLDPTRTRIGPTGRLPTEQLDAARALTADPATRPRRLIVACHYPVAAPPAYEIELSRKRMKNDYQVRAWLEGLGPHVYCCGHVHAAWAFRPASLPDELCLNSGAPLMNDPTARRLPGFLEINLDGDAVEVIHQAWDSTGWKAIPMYSDAAFCARTSQPADPRRQGAAQSA